jgi:hypothetical protein
VKDILPTFREGGNTFFSAGRFGQNRLRRVVSDFPFRAMGPSEVEGVGD